MLEIRKEIKNNYDEVYDVIKTAFETAEQSDGNEHDLVVALRKSENYYPKFNYVPAIQYGIKAPFEVPNENFMAIKLNDTDAKIEGTVEYAKEFGI